MRQAHPASGPAYGIVTRVVSTNAGQSVANVDTVVITVQVQQAENAGDPSRPTAISYKQATVSFERQSDQTYLLNGIVWKDIQR